MLKTIFLLLMIINIFLGVAFYIMKDYSQASYHIAFAILILNLGDE